MVIVVIVMMLILLDIESMWKGLLVGESGIYVFEDEFVIKWDLVVKIGGYFKDLVDSYMG